MTHTGSCQIIYNNDTQTGPCLTLSDLELFMSYIYKMWSQVWELIHRKFQISRTNQSTLGYYTSHHQPPAMEFKSVGKNQLMGNISCGQPLLQGSDWENYNCQDTCHPSSRLAHVLQYKLVHCILLKCLTFLEHKMINRLVHGTQCLTHTRLWVYWTLVLQWHTWFLLMSW